MTLYRYSARASDGSAVQGQIDSGSAALVASHLSASGLTPVEIVASDAAKSGLDLLRPKGRVRIDDLVMFCRQMHSLTRAGVPVVRALRGLADSTRNARLQEVLRDVAENLNAGRDLTQGLQQHPEVFPSLLINTIEVGESTGGLETAFLQSATYLERESETVKRLRSATRYPIFVVFAVIVAVVVINVLVVPAFSDVFQGFGADLPLPTQILIGTSNFMVGYWVYLLLLCVGAAAAWRIWIRSEKGRYTWDRYRMRIPIVGPLIERATLARFARGFSVAQRAGLPVIQTLTTVARAVDDAYVGDKLIDLGERISRGESLGSSAATSGLFTPLVLQMITVGEESGSLDELLDEVAEYYEREVDHDLKRISDAIEPVMIGVLGGIVLVLALGVYLPLWDMASLTRMPH